MQFRFEIEPVSQARPRARRIGKGIMLYDPKNVKQFKEELHALAEQRYQYAPLEGELTVEVTFYRRVQNSISRLEHNRRLTGEVNPTVKPDIDNYIKSALDALNGVIWKDDNQITNLIAHKRYAEKPRIEMTVIER